MEASKPSRLPERNPVTHARHRKDVFWQITVPFGLFFLLILLLIAGVIWAGFAGIDQVSRWADISLIWLLIPVIGLSLLVLAVTVGMVVGLGKLLQVLPRAMHLVQQYFWLAESQVKRVADKLVEPVLKIHSFLAGAGALRRK